MRKKTFIVMSVVTVLYLVFWAVMLHFYRKEVASMENFSGQIAMVSDYIISQMSLQFSSMLMALLTIMMASGAVSSDMESGIIHGIISRPLHRSAYIGGKLIGLAAISCAYATVLFAFLWGIGVFFDLAPMIGAEFSTLVRGWAVYLVMPVTVLCVALCGSVSIKTVPNGILMMFIYILGYIGGMVEQVGGLISSATMVSAGIFLSLISPFNALYITAERILMPTSGLAGDLARISGGLGGGGADYTVWMYVHIGIYMLFAVILAMGRFSKKDIT